ncbi:MAG: Hsp20/alpha crystallin family protein [Planctomycetes bacterium]|nr:Hsp20/alpha crystallin family protein [Planctomycetota bacterium]
MSEKNARYTKLMAAVIILFAAIVVVQSVFLFQMNKQISRAIGTQTKTVKSPVTPGRSVASPKTGPLAMKKPDAKILPGPGKNLLARPFDLSLDDDWFNQPFNPDTWNPFEEMQQMQEHMDRVFDRAFGRLGEAPRFQPFVRDLSYSPKLDVTEQKDRYVIHVDLPGVDQSNVKVEVKGQVLTISGKREKLVEQKDQKGRVVQRERRTGQFERRLRLPKPLDAAKMKTKQENGILTIILPKR